MLPLATDSGALLPSRRRTSANRINVNRQRRAVNRIIVEAGDYFRRHSAQATLYQRAGDTHSSGDERSHKSSTPSQSEQRSSNSTEGTRNEGLIVHISPYSNRLLQVRCNVTAAAMTNRRATPHSVPSGRTTQRVYHYAVFYSSTECPHMYSCTVVVD